MPNGGRERFSIGSMPLDDVTPRVAVDVPGAHLGLRWRAPEPADLDAIVALTRRVAAADDLVHLVTPRELAVTAFGTHATSLVGLDGDGTPRAGAWVTGGGGEHVALGMVDPARRATGIGRALVGWQVDVAKAILAGRPGSLHGFIDDGNLPRRRLHAAAGFAPGPRSVHLVRRLDAADADVAAPGDPDQDADVGTGASCAELAAFLDHLGGTGEPCARTELLEAPPVPEILDPEVTVTRSGPAGLEAVLASTEPVCTPGEGGECVVESHLLAARDEADAEALVRRAWRVLAARGITAHVLHAPTGSPWRDVFDRLGYSLAGTQTRFTVRF